MYYENNKVKDLKIAYIGGGSRGWAWGLMSDLASAPDISGKVALYDIDKQAALDNVIIGSKFNDAEGALFLRGFSILRSPELLEESCLFDSNDVPFGWSRPTGRQPLLQTYIASKNILS